MEGNHSLISPSRAHDDDGLGVHGGDRVWAQCTHHHHSQSIHVWRHGGVSL